MTTQDEPKPQDPLERAAGRARRAGAAVLLLGLGLQLWLTYRSWFYFDQVLLYKLGIGWVAGDGLYPFAKVVSGAGVIPGALLQLAVGLPLEVWFDYRSPILFLGLAQLAAAVVLWRVVARTFGESVAAFYLAIYWLGPWRLYHSGFLWEPIYLLLPAALHLWATVRLRDRGEPLASATLGLVVAVAVQLHPSGIALAILTGLLLATRSHRLHAVWAAAGAIAGGLTLLPTASAWMSGRLPSILTGSHWSELGLFRVYPLTKDLTYWLRLGSLDVGRRLRQSELPEAFAWTIPVLSVLGAASIALALWATIRFFRRRAAPDSAAGSLVRRYCIFALVGHLLAMGVSSVTPQGWHCLVLLHAASLPVALLCSRWLGSHDRQPGRSKARGSRPLRLLLWSFLFLRVPIVLVIGLGHPMYVEPEGDPNRARIDSGHFEAIELVPIPFGGDSSVRGPVPWDDGSATED